MKIVEVTWRDSRMYITQCTTEEDFSVCVIRSLGYLIKKNKEFVVITGDLLEDDDIRRTIIIPVENIKSLKYLK